MLHFSPQSVPRQQLRKQTVQLVTVSGCAEESSLLLTPSELLIAFCFLPDKEFAFPHEMRLKFHTAARLSDADFGSKQHLVFLRCFFEHINVGSPFLIFVTVYRNVRSESHFLPAAYRLYPDMENKINETFLRSLMIMLKYMFNRTT